MTSRCGVAEKVLVAARRAADPAAALARAMEPRMGAWVGQGVWLLSIGKAGRTMLAAGLGLLARAGVHVHGALATAPPKHAGVIDGVEVLACDHPYPTERNLDAARRVLEFVRAVPREGRLVVLLSGGGSAHLTLPWEGLTLEDLRGVNRALQRAGAAIGELNCVRKHTERLKGGRLAAECAASAIEVLALSDVLGDPLDVIASGPFAADPTTFQEAIAVMRARGVEGAFPAVDEHLRRGAGDGVPETPKRVGRVETRVIANNGALVEGVAEELQALGITVVERRGGVTGEAAEVGRVLGRGACGLAAGEALVWGGETTVNVGSAPGVGGPSQEAALACAAEIAGSDVCVLAYSSDGADGPTDAAGAVVDGATWSTAIARGLDPAAALARHDSHALLDALEALIRTGPTGTNVNHVMAAWRA